jgi:hypothetical protein
MVLVGVLAVALAVALAACGSQAPTAAAPATPSPAPAAPDPTVIPAGPVPSTPTIPEPAPAQPDAARAPPADAPPSLRLATEVVAVEPSGELPLQRDGETVVDPASSFRVVLAARFDDARLLLLDAADAAVPAKGTRVVGTSTALTLSPTTPLRPGSRYQLRVDGDRTRDLHDETGAAHAPFTLPVLAAGTPPPPEPPPKKKAKRSRR